MASSKEVSARFFLILKHTDFTDIFVMHKVLKLLYWIIRQTKDTLLSEDQKAFLSESLLEFVP